MSILMSICMERYDLTLFNMKKHVTKDLIKLKCIQLLLVLMLFVRPFQIHPKLHNINFHNVTHSLISQNLKERMFVVQISLLIVTFLSLISRNLSLMQIVQAYPHPCIAPCVNMWSVFFFFFFFHLLNVGACVHHIAREGQENEFKLPSHLLCVIPSWHMLH